MAAQPINIFVEQDGASFTVYSNADYPGRSVDAVCALKREFIEYPNKVADFDMAAAVKARDWFVATLQPHGIVPVFEADADISCAERIEQMWEEHWAADEAERAAI